MATLRSKSGGFTLTELMIALAVLGILVSAGLPSMINLVRDQRIKTAASDVFASLIFARSEAIKRGERVVLCAANATVDGCSGTANWEAGWIVFIDPDADRVPDAAAEILRKNGPVPNVAINGPANSAADNVTYQRDGRLIVAVTNFTVTSPDNPAITNRCIRMDPSGRPNIKAGC